MITSRPSPPADVLKFPERPGPLVGSSRLSVACRSAWPICTLTFCGSLDSGSSIALQSQFDQVGCGSFTEVVLDIEGLTRIDAAGNAALNSLKRLIRARGGRVRVQGSLPPL